MRVGVIGAGWVGTHRHIPGLRRLDNVTIAGVFDRKLARAQAAVEELSDCIATDDIDQLFQTNLDAVVICTSPWSHAELTVQALRAGHHVLTEKPMAMNSDEARKMVSAAEQADRLLCVSHNFLFSNSVRKANRLLGGARPHYVLGMQMSSDRRRLPAWYQDLPGGLLFDELPHFMYLLHHFLGDLQFEGVRAVTRPKEARHPTTVEIQVSSPSGDAQVIVLGDSPLSEWHLTLVAQDRVIGLDLFRDIPVQLTSDDEHGALDILKTSAKAVSGHVAGFVASGARLATGRMSWGHDELIRRFVAAVTRGAPPPVSLGQATRVVEVTDRIIESL